VDWMRVAEACETSNQRSRAKSDNALEYRRKQKGSSDDTEEAVVVIVGVVDCCSFKGFTLNALN
jgi:hypothetical protein